MAAARFNQKTAEERGYTKADWDDVADNPTITKADVAKGRSFKDALPELYENIQRSRGRPALDNPKKVVSIRLDPDVIDKFKATGKGWQSRINAILKDAKV
jgi:uncharacterized protein (DUF4415 family)